MAIATGEGMLLDGKTAIVTGGAAGIGRAVCERLAAEGAAVVIADVDASRGAELEASLRRKDMKAWFIVCDVADLAAIDSMIARAAELAGRINVLVNNAGVTRRIGLLDIDEASWDWIQAVNTKGLFFCLQRAAAHMKENGGGRIVNMASISGKGMKGASNASYAASKGAALALTRVAATELAPYGINVNAVCPGVTRTELVDRMIQQNPAVIDDVVASSVLRRFMEPADIADAVLFLCSPLSNNITGQSINVDGGTMWD